MTGPRLASILASRYPKDKHVIRFILRYRDLFNRLSVVPLEEICARIKPLLEVREQKTLASKYTAKPKQKQNKQ